ncbi:MAG: glucose-6-phosphate isomerase [Oligoflexia bacterium]|nr:glucose-6-phosphate isomerase [Oligoflexia bacterium]
MPGKPYLKFSGQSQTLTIDWSQLISQVEFKAQKQSEMLAWVHLPKSKEHVLQVKAWLSRTKSFETLVVLGIGGSSLGGRAALDFLPSKKQVIFLDNIDGFHFETAIKALNLKKTHFLAISKSGGTSETLFQMAHILGVLKSKKLSFAKHLSVMTEDTANVMKGVSQELGLTEMKADPNVGGRFSVLSAVGLAPMAWAGVPVEKVLEGASWAQNQREMIAQICEFYFRSWNRANWISIFWIYCQGLKSFGAWLQQLWAESLAKAVNLHGHEAPRVSTPLPCLGATDQHSLLQQFVEGAPDKSFLFIRNSESEKSSAINKVFSEQLYMTKGKSVGSLLGIEATASETFLKEKGLLAERLTVLDHSPESIGALFYIFEMVVAVLGEALEINAFNQPGVEGVKKLTHELLQK